jgi:hypothetical protein
VSVWAVFGCVGSTTELAFTAGTCGYDVWVPTLEVRRVHSRLDPVTKTKKVEVTLVRVPAIPGYIFVRFEQWCEFTNWAPDKYKVRLYMRSAGDSKATATNYTTNKQPAQIRAEELEILGDACESLWEELYDTPEAVEALSLLEVGDHVSLQGHKLFEDGTVGLVEKCRPTGFVRLLIPLYGKFIEIHRKFIRGKVDNTP